MQSAVEIGKPFTVFTPESAAALIKFFDSSVRCIFKGGAYSGAALI